jgi:ferritin
MKMLISEALETAICEQIGHELYNANLYLFICGYLRNKGLDNIAKHFEGQAEEENKHAKEFFDLMTDMNADIYIPEINEINIDINTIKDIATLYLEREIVTTKSIQEIRLLAMGDNNPVVEEKMREMIGKQQHEYAEATRFMDNAILCEGADSWWKVKVWSDSIK